MANYYAQVALASQSGDSADVNVNTFAISDEDILSSIRAGEWNDEIKQFYDDVHALGMLCGRAATGHVTKILAADGSVPNYPIFTYTWSLTAGTFVLDLPDEVALCVSYANDSLDSVPRRRRRGRIYLSGNRESGNAAGRPLAAVYEGLALAYADYVTATNAIVDVTAGIWSRTNAAVYPVERVWCDNEWDTMRSRGGKATMRETIIV